MAESLRRASSSKACVLLCSLGVSCLDLPDVPRREGVPSVAVSVAVGRVLVVCSVCWCAGLGSRVSFGPTTLPVATVCSVGWCAGLTSTASFGPTPLPAKLVLSLLGVPFGGVRPAGVSVVV